MNVTNLPLYRVLRSLDVPELEAEAAAAASMPDLSNLVTRDQLRADLADLRTDMTQGFGNLNTKIAGFDTKIAGLETKIAGVEANIVSSALRQTVWSISTLFALAGLMLAYQRYVPAPSALPPAAPAAILVPQSSPAPTATPTQPVTPPR